MPDRQIVFWEVDAQEDFMLPGGNLYVPGAEKIIPNIQRLVKAAFDAHLLLVSSGDAHSESDLEFETFPAHCVRGTAGARIISEGMNKQSCTIPNDPAFQVPQDILSCPQIVIEKQTLDVFDNPFTSVLIGKLDRDAEYIVFGVVTEFCVRCAAKGLLERGRSVSIVKDAIESIAPREAGRSALDELRIMGAHMISTDQAVAKANEVRARASSAQ